MKQGRNIHELAAEIERQAGQRHDYVARAQALRLSDSGRLELPGIGDFGVNDTAHNQLAEFADVPTAYYRRIQTQHPALLATTVNTILASQPATAKRLVRTLDGNGRAFLSDRYRCIDHVDLMQQLLPVLFERSDLRFASAEVTEKRLYIKVVSDELVGDVKAGDTVRMGLLISNSEVGLGSVLVAPFSERLICTNGATHTDLGQRRTHLGRGQLDGEGESWQVFSDETRKADDRAFFLKVRDTIKSALTGDTLQKLLTHMREAAGERIDGDPTAMVETVGANLGLSESERTGVLRNLIEGADLSRWGLANAVTRAAQDVASYDRATELEAFGGSMMLRPLPSDVQRVAARRRRVPEPSMS